MKFQKDFQQIHYWKKAFDCGFGFECILVVGVSFLRIGIQVL